MATMYYDNLSAYCINLVSLIYYNSIVLMHYSNFISLISI